MKRSVCCCWWFILTLVAVIAPRIGAEEAYRDFEFRETLHPDFIYRLEPQPWEPEKKAHVKGILDWLYDEYPGFMKHIACNGSVSLYRTPKTQLDYIDQPAYGGIRMVGFFDYDKSNPRVEKTIIHELTHVADALHRLANSKEWRSLMEPRMERVVQWQRENQSDKSLTGYIQMGEKEIALLDEVGLPSFYSASALAEGLAEVTAYMIIGRKYPERRYEPPEDLKAFVEEHLFSEQVSSYPSGEHYIRGLLLARKALASEALEEYEKAVEADPEFINARLALAGAKYSKNDGLLEEKRSAYSAEILQIQELISRYDRTRRLWALGQSMGAMKMTGDREGAMGIVELINREYPPESRGPREYRAFTICGDGYAMNGDAEEALEQYEKAVALVPFKQYEMTNRIGGLRMALAETSEEKWAAHDKTILQMWQPLAEKGQPAAMLTLGKMYIWGTQTPKDYPEAVRWLTEARHAGDKAADYWLAYVYSTGDGLVEKNPDLARHWARLSADSEDEKGLYLLGVLLLEDGEFDAAVQLLKQSFEKGHRPAAYELGRIFSSNEYGREDREAATEWYRKAAEKRHGLAMYELARIYVEEGKVQEALPLLADSAKQGNVVAQFYFGKLLAQTEPPTRESTAAAYWWLSVSIADSSMTATDRKTAEALQADVKAKIAPDDFAGLSKNLEAFLKKKSESRSR